MKWIGHAGLKKKADKSVWVGMYIMRSRGRYSGGFGSEVFRLLRDYAVEVGANRVVSTATDPERQAALRQAGFKSISRVPGQHPRRIRRHGWLARDFEWRAP